MTATTRHPILIVDDEPEILYSLRGLLRREFEIHTAESGAEALEVLKQHPIHLVMTDQRMPELTGVELLAKVKSEWPDVVRVVFTGYADVKAVIEAINLGQIFRYITKPWDPDELLSVLHQACEEHERIVERQRLLDEIRGYKEQVLALLDGLRDGRLGALNPAGQAYAEQLGATGWELLGRIDQTPPVERSETG